LTLVAIAHNGNLSSGRIFDDITRAQELWRDPYLIEIPAMTVDEPRYLVIGRIGAQPWSAVITYRSENIRIISVRRSRHEEVALYEG